jgi:hypothetical protein
MDSARCRPAADVIPVYFVSHFAGGGAGVTTVEFAMKPADITYANAVFMNCGSLANSTLSHEFFHVLCDVVHDGPDVLWSQDNTKRSWCIWYVNNIWGHPEAGVVARKRILDTMRSRLFKSKFCKNPTP